VHWAKLGRSENLLEVGRLEGPAHITNRTYQERDAGGAGVVIRGHEAVRPTGDQIEERGTEGGPMVSGKISKPVT
jgi:hypothetical protein